MPICARSAYRASQRAFTLLELLTTLAIIAVLVSLGFGAVRRVSEAGRTTRARAELQVLSAALDNYQRMFGDYPHTDNPADFLRALIGRRGPLLDMVDARAFLETARFNTADNKDPYHETGARIVDPWGNPYHYIYRASMPWLNPRFVLYSAGPDGQSNDTLRAGGFFDAASPANLDNIYAEP